MKSFTRNLSRVVAPLGLGFSALFGNVAYAAVPAEVTTAVATAQADLLTAIGAVIAAMVVVWGLRTLGKKMGWLS
jgi:hypothetical protein